MNLTIEEVIAQLTLIGKTRGMGMQSETNVQDICALYYYSAYGVDLITGKSAELADAEDEIEDLEKEVDKLENENKILERDIRDLRRKLHDLASEE